MSSFALMLQATAIEPLSAEVAAAAAGGGLNYLQLGLEPRMPVQFGMALVLLMAAG